MRETDAHFKRIQEKLHLLIRQQTSLQKENTQLKQELSQSQKLLDQHAGQVEALRQQVNVLKLNAGEMNDSDKKEFEKRISTYIKEIDRCIALLGE